MWLQPILHSPILLNRFETIRLNGYTRSEKIKIATDYIIPELITEYRVEEFGLIFTTELIEHLVDIHAHDSGIRSLKRSLKMLIEAIVMIHYTGGERPTNITIAEYRRIMQVGVPKAKRSAKKNKQIPKIDYNY